MSAFLRRMLRLGLIMSAFLHRMLSRGFFSPPVPDIWSHAQAAGMAGIGGKKDGRERGGKKKPFRARSFFSPPCPGHPVPCPGSRAQAAVIPGIGGKD